jgi:hypothetical protein
MSEVANTGDVETVKQLMANFVKVETNVHICPLVSLYKLLCFILYADERCGLDWDIHFGSTNRAGLVMPQY